MTRKSLILIALSLALIVLTALAVRTAAAPQPPPADLVLTNGKIVTVDDAMPEAQALAVRGDRIVALGTSADIRRYVGPATEVVDLQGQLAIPGFIEGHGHFNGVGTAELQLKLMKTTSWDEIVSMVAAAVKTAKPGQWIYGRGWHQEKWTSRPDPNVEGFPTHASLDAVSPDNPVVLTHASGHASFANSLALQLSDISRTTPNPPGGELLRDAAGDADRAAARARVRLDPRAAPGSRRPPRRSAWREAAGFSSSRRRRSSRRASRRFRMPARRLPTST